MALNIKLILFFLITTWSLSQNITFQLKEKISKSSKKDFIPITIELKKKINFEDLKKQFTISQTPIKKRASIVAKKLQEDYKEDQKEVIKIIKSNQNDFKKLHQFWAVNMIFLEATPDLIKLLNNNQFINKIDLELGYMKPLIAQSQPPIQINGGNSTEPGIEAINIRPLWEMGYTGKGTLVFNYDTGVWPTHPAFSDRFFGNYYPLEQCWDGYFSETPNGLNDHGTHTMGIIGGLVNETNDTIGSAYNCYWIANDFVTSTVEELPPVVDMVTSFEWSLNPDGDLNTDYDVPDVINNSWRWYNPIDTIQCEGYIVDLMNVIELAGIGNIFSAGNDGPNNEGVKAPQRINTNLVNTFCVGSVNANTEDLIISTFSTRGPTQCPSSGGSLEIYPEVSAPGQSVRSASGENGFDVKSGTSMAAPHVTGCFLLLKEAFPFLSGEEILLAIYYTAVDLGEPGEDNTYGMGMIDGLAAFNYLQEIYEPVIPNLNSDDLSIKSISNTPQNINCESSFSPILTVGNNGNNTLSGFKISYFNEGLLEEEYFFEDEVINPNQEIEINLPPIDNFNIGDIELSFTIESLENINEIDYHNNRRMVRFKHKPTFNLPYNENFENGINYSNWNIVNTDFSRTWESIQTSGIENSDSSIYVNIFGYNPRDGQKDEIISPSINLTGDSILLNFFTSYQKYTNSIKQDTLQILISNNCGMSFEDTIYNKGGEELNTFEIQSENFIPFEENHWRKESVYLNQYIGQEILLKFITTNYRGNNITIDNINIFNENGLNNYYLEGQTIQIFPNPTNGKLNIKLVNTHLDQFFLTNSIGKIIQTGDINEPFIKINLNNKPKGTYIINLIGKKTIIQRKIILI